MLMEGESFHIIIILMGEAGNLCNIGNCGILISFITHSNIFPVYKTKI